MSNEIAPPAALRLITTNDANGDSHFEEYSPPAFETGDSLGGGAWRRLAYTFSQPPLNLTQDADFNIYKATFEPNVERPLVPSGGATNVWFVEIPPGSSSPVHRTVSLDFVAVLKGDVELKLSGGETKIVTQGEVVIQRSTLHAWTNCSKTEWARLFSVMVHCEPVRTDSGKILAQEFRAE